MARGLLDELDGLAGRVSWRGPAVRSGATQAGLGLAAIMADPARPRTAGGATLNQCRRDGGASASSQREAAGRHEGEMAHVPTILGSKLLPLARIELFLRQILGDRSEVVTSQIEREAVELRIGVGLECRPLPDATQET